jgi:hypothetical protein
LDTKNIFDAQEADKMPSEKPHVLDSGVEWGKGGKDNAK